MKTTRELERLVAGRETSDGAGVRLRRVLTADLQRRLDPFLMLDAFGSDRPDDYIAGFPDHPHRGFETVTYLLDGEMEHRDNHGGHGLLKAGGVQWMTAGRGIVHSELPRQKGGLLRGFQLWLNLPAADKLGAPAYRDIAADEIPRYVADGGTEVKVIAGRSGGVRGAVERAATEPLYLDIAIPPHGRFEHALAAELHAFVYVYEGSVSIAGRGVPAGHMGVLAQTPGADGVELLSGGDTARLLLIAGRPLQEPIAQWGPFVMNSREEIETAIDDFRNGRF